jgi:hypothetical protein
MFSPASTGHHVLTILISLVYKALFLLALKHLFSCEAIDLGKRQFLVFDMVPNTHLFLSAINLFLLLMTYLLRCIPAAWTFFYIL